jgi:ABC-type branched-subunit amino acid transport system permease subunit
VLILVALAWRGDMVPGRTAIAPRRFAPSPTPRHPSIVVAVVSLAGFVAALTFDAAHRQALVVSLIATVLGLSVVVVTGYAGLISLAPLAIAGVSGFTLVHLADAGVPFPLDLLIATAVGCVVGVAMGASASRLRGSTFAVATLALAVAVEQLVLASTSFSGGTAGRAAPRPHFAGIDLGAAARGADDVRRPFVVLLVVVLAIALTLVVNLRRSHTGLRWLALRANERAAAAAGIDVARAKLTAMGTSSALAGLAGGLTAYATSTLSPASFMVVGALVVVALTFLGGISSVWGAVIGGLLAQSGIVTTLGNGGRTSSGDLTSAIAGLVLVAAASLAPDGVAGRTRALASAVRDRLAGAHR